MTKRYFEFSEGTSNKFWEVWRDGTVVNTRYGKIGAHGQSTLKDEGSEAAAEKLWARLINEKTKKGYVERDAPKAAPAPKVEPKPKGATPITLKGKTVVVTGTFARPRKELEKLLVAAGCTVGSSVTPKTELLLVGNDAGSKLSKAQALGIATMTEAEFDALETPKNDTPGPRASTAEWEVYADQLQTNGDPRGEVLALQLTLEAKPKAAEALRKAEREAIEPLLTGALKDALARFDALVAKLKADENVVLLAYFTHPPVTEREIAKVEHALGVPLHASILTFFRQTNGLQLYADRRDRDDFDDEFEPVGEKYDKKAIDAMWRFSENFQLPIGLHIPTLSEVFLANGEGQLWFDHMTDDEETTFGRKTYPLLSFSKSLRPLDVHNGFYPVGLALIDNPGNPRVGLGDDHGAAWEDTKVTDFETYLSTVLKHGADSEKTVNWFQR
ncbi:MAG: WGR domain-containing protein [Archangiaceae bacterium]|nr:WGR domain-containing protein [Archangiaceae bacterium]